MTLISDFESIIENLKEVTCTRPLNDHRIKIGNDYIGTWTDDNAKFIEFCYKNKTQILEGLRIRERFPQKTPGALLDRAMGLMKAKEARSTPEISV